MAARRKVKKRAASAGVSIPVTARRRVGPRETAGVGGTPIVGGYILSREKEASLAGREKYTRYAEILTNIAIIGAAVRGFLNLVGSVTWKVEPKEDGGGEAEKIAETVQAIFDDMTSPWGKVIRRAAMYRFNGFAIQEWTAKRRDDGAIGFLDIESRPCHTIDRWDVDEGGTLHGVVQVNPATGKDHYLPRAKLFYCVDDTLTDSPDGLGIFRHCIEPAKRIQRYAQIEGLGFETDLRGIPIGRAPIERLKGLVAQGTITQAEADKAINEMLGFLDQHIRTAEIGFLLESEPYRTIDEHQTPSAIPQWGLELLKGEGTSASHDAIGNAINREVRSLARLLFSEHLLLGESGAGSLAMHKDKTAQFAGMVDATVGELVEGVEADLLPPLFALNGWDPALTPVVKAESVEYRDVVELTTALRNLATAGVMLTPEEEAIGEVFDLMRLTRPTKMLGAVELAQATKPPPIAGDEEDSPPAEKPAKKFHKSRGHFAKRKGSAAWPTR